MLTFTANQLIAHLVGDYFLQSDWMALEKTKKSVAAGAHSFTYTLPFLALTTSWQALLFICLTHFAIDRWRLARYICWIKNYVAPRWIEVPACSCDKTETCRKCDTKIFVRNYPWSECEGTGYHKDRPPWLTVWLLIITDNTMHLICNGVALWLFALQRKDTSMELHVEIYDEGGTTLLATYDVDPRRTAYDHYPERKEILLCLEKYLSEHPVRATTCHHIITTDQATQKTETYKVVTEVRVVSRLTHVDQEPIPYGMQNTIHVGNYPYIVMY